MNTIYDYYTRMRGMANAFAKAGNFMFTCVSKGEVIMSPLDINLNYADQCFELALQRNSNGEGTNGSAKGTR